MVLGPTIGNGRMWVGDASIYFPADGKIVLTPVTSGVLAGAWTCGSLTETSTRASKRDIRPMGRARARRLLAVDPVTFQKVGEDDSAPREIGLVAEELAAADLEELIGRDEAGEIVGIRYSRLAVMLLAIVRQQDERIDALEAAAPRLPPADRP